MLRDSYLVTDKVQRILQASGELGGQGPSFFNCTYHSVANIHYMDFNFLNLKLLRTVIFLKKHSWLYTL